MTVPADELAFPSRGDGARAPAIPALVLAGGASRRMDGWPKALLPWPPGTADSTFVASICATLREAGFGPVAVVSGAHHEQMAAAHPEPPWDALLFNAAHANGQLTSVWRGLDWAEGLGGMPQWLAVALVDVPGVAVATLRALAVAAARVSATEAARPPVLVRPAIGARHGHPVLWHRDAWPLLRAAPVEVGARSAVRALAAFGRVLDVPVSDRAVLRDVDTDEDYRALR